MVFTDFDTNLDIATLVKINCTILIRLKAKKNRIKWRTFSNSTPYSGSLLDKSRNVLSIISEYFTPLDEGLIILPAWNIAPVCRLCDTTEGRVFFFFFVTRVTFCWIMIMVFCTMFISFVVVIPWHYDEWYILVAWLFDVHYVIVTTSDGEIHGNLISGMSRFIGNIIVRTRFFFNIESNVLS